VQIESFIDSHALHDAFLGNQLSRLVDLIVDQGDELLRDAGLSFAARAASTILLVHERDKVSTADIARELHQPHQLATQRVETLIASGLLKRRNDPQDGRRKILSLTVKGTREAESLKLTLHQAQQAFQEVYDEVEVNLGAVALRAIEALNRNSLAARIKAADGEPGRQGKSKRRKIHA
jgi:DNA-binding MarR family transcriptional regulator